MTEIIDFEELKVIALANYINEMIDTLNTMDTLGSEGGHKSLRKQEREDNALLSAFTVITSKKGDKDEKDILNALKKGASKESEIEYEVQDNLQRISDKSPQDVISDINAIILAQTLKDIAAVHDDYSAFTHEKNNFRSALILAICDDDNFTGKTLDATKLVNDYLASRPIPATDPKKKEEIDQQYAKGVKEGIEQADLDLARRVIETGNLHGMKSILDRYEALYDKVAGRTPVFMPEQTQQ